MKRVLGRSGIEVSALGVGTWAMGGEMFAGDQPLGRGAADDAESARAIRRAADLVPVCEELVEQGLIRTYGWSTDNPAGVDVFAAGPHCSVVLKEIGELLQR
ncbi:MAG TPA: hypothetical protein VGP31_09165 [Planosporangium sp.]|jgi:aryl-alcohol dehydrogenase-like predicted oxidoreductase|nr:hypothetical protein [Planosporangium sp.]